jgi:hypothetical protein
VALALARDGWDVLTTGLPDDGADAIVEELRATGVRATWHADNPGDPDAAARSSRATRSPSTAGCSRRTRRSSTATST